MEDKARQAFGIPFAALVSVIFGMMAVSFPVGIYVFFNTNIGDEINYEYPLFSDWTEIASGLEIGDAFVIVWCAYAVIFGVAMMGPKKNFFKELSPIMNEGHHSSSSYMVTMIKWFAILVLVSAAINLVQESLDITIEPPITGNDLVQFFDITQAPLIEEVGFRIILVGLPIYLLYSHRASARHLLKSLWHPYEHLHIHENKKALVIIVIVAALFGVAHVIFGESWSSGKIAQATAGGLILGWVYYRYGLAPALLIHWATNYFVYSYAYLISEINLVTVSDAFSHSMMQTFEIIFLAAGIISVIMIVYNKIKG